MDADGLIAELGLAPHPEGGWYAETWRAPVDGPTDRAGSTAIYFLLRRGERSHWHVVDADEIWLHHGGAPVRLRTAPREGPVTARRVGPVSAEGDRPQAVVPAGIWQSAESTGEWSLVSCVVAPGFTFDGFTLAPPAWEPGQPSPAAS